jgi:subtilase family serine protease
VPAPGGVACFAIVRSDIGGGAPGGYHGQFRATDSHSLAAVDATPEGYGPKDLASAYKLPSTGGSGQTIAVVDAYDDPNAASDLAVYRSQFGLGTCTVANGCFKKVGENGTSTLPPENAGWDQEISLDLDAVSAVCPKCHILLVETSSESSTDFERALNTAASLHATEISNSYGGNEFEATDSAYDHPGIIITASAGDDGTGAEQPAAYSTVVAVGGTVLDRANNTRGWTETAWADTGSGCSAYVAKPAWQTDKGCKMRSEADVSADADPDTGIAVYDSVKYQGSSGWLIIGGTSLSSPLIAGVFALNGNASELTAARHIWTVAGSHLFDVTSGSNGSCSISYICNAGPGYDGPTGWGTPNGPSTF